MRIITGKHRGRKLLESREFKDLRPTSDKNRENLFNVLFSSKIIKEAFFDKGLEISDCNFLDVFSGSGAVSFEALSRGVKFAGLIEKNRDHLDLSKANAEILKENNLEFFCADVCKTIFKSYKQYDLVFIDPPYNKDLAATALLNLDKTQWIADHALIIVEHFFAEKLTAIETEFELIEKRQYKDTIFSFYKKSISKT
ncbi:MAG: 16S rRNA (guanine966-N2)-methyltransferase [Rickettsiales bacterium]|jgi:16S rRNA (guanine966-N2)-methyltransferase